MRKTSHYLVLAGALVAAGTLQGNAAHAAVTGQVGVGTWNTQAEFADVKVVSGTQTLYQSNFLTGFPGWTTSGGTWATQGGYLRQTGGGTPALALVGSTSWSNYTLTLRARKISGSEGFLISFGVLGSSTTSWWNLGGYNNTKHVILSPGVSAPDVAGTIQTGVWYDIKVQLNNNDIRCYLNGALVQDTTRILDGSERTARIQQILNSPGYALLTQIEKDTLNELFNRPVYLGAAARATFNSMPSGTSFSALSAANQLAIIRKVGANRLTWNTGYGFGGDAYRDQTIINSMDASVLLYNSLGVFDKHVTANNDPGVPTADANYDGWMRFGQQMNYRTALHELGHCMGVGTAGNWRNFFVNGVWTGQYTTAQVVEFDGAGAVIRDAGIHFYPYGLNYDNELGGDNDRRHVLIVKAMRRDMGIASTLWMPISTSVANGTYRLTPRNATGSALDVLNAGTANSTSIDINAYSGAAKQKFLLDLQSDGSYRIRTSLAGNRCVELPNGIADNGTKIKLWDNNGNSAQRWFLVPMDNGWYKIAPKNNMYKGMDIDGGPGSTANGSLVHSWDYFDGLNQQWQLTPVTAAMAAPNNGSNASTSQQAS